MIKQRSAEWRKQRIGRVTGSRAGAILGLSPYQTVDDVLRAMVREYHGAESEFTGNVATEWGTANEATVLFDYEMETGNKVEECGFYSYEDWLGASPDGLVGSDGLVEFKAPYSLRNGGAFKPLSEQPHYHAQMMVEMICTNREWCDFVQWSPVLGLRIERVEFDSSWFHKHCSVLKDFHNRYLSVLHNPEHLEPLRKTVTQVKALQMVDEYEELKDAIDRAKERQADILEELVLYSGGKNATIGQKKLTKVERKGTISYAKVVKDHCPKVDLKPYTGPKTEYWKLS